jgi:hypothetical protein
MIHWGNDREGWTSSQQKLRCSIANVANENSALGRVTYDAVVAEINDVGEI